MESWPSSVNDNFYNLEKSAISNVNQVQYESGRIRTYKIASRQLYQFTFSVSLTREEELAFWEWYETTLASGSKTWSHTDFLKATETKEYLFASDPVPGEDSYPIEYSLTVKEV